MSDVCKTCNGSGIEIVVFRDAPYCSWELEEPCSKCGGHYDPKTLEPIPGSGRADEED